MSMRRSRKTGAPRNPISHLTPEQERALNAHLRLGLPDPDAKRLFAAIDHWLFYGPWSATPEAQEWHADNRARSGRIAQLARALRCELEAEREREGIIVHGLDWPSLGASLEESLGDLHGQIIRTLKRRPASPFVLTLHDS